MAGNLPHILVFCPYYPPHTGGLETHADGFNRYLSARGFSISVFTPRLPLEAPVTETRYAGVRIYRFPAFEIIANYPLPKFWLPEFWRLLNRAATPLPAITVSRTRFFFTSFMALLFAKIRHTRYVHIEHGSDFVHLHDPVKNTLAWLYDQTFGRASLWFSDLNIANSEASAGFCRRLSFDKKCHVVYRGLDTDRLDGVRPVTGLAARYPGKTILYFVGRLYAGKGVRDLLSSLAPLTRSSWQLLIAGDGPDRQYLHRQAADLGLTPNIEFLGNLDWPQAMAYMKASAVVINPSYTEGLPTSVIEAGLCGKPVIATNVGGTPEISGPDYPYLYSPGDTAALSVLLQALIADPKRAAAAGRALTGHIGGRFAWQKNILLYEKLFLGLK